MILKQKDDNWESVVDKGRRGHSLSIVNCPNPSCGVSPKLGERDPCGSEAGQGSKEDAYTALFSGANTKEAAH